MIWKRKEQKEPRKLKGRLNPNLGEHFMDLFLVGEGEDYPPPPYSPTPPV